MVQDITRRKLAEEERDQANARLALQYAVTRTLAEVRHLGEASGKVVQSICETMSWDDDLLLPVRISRRLIEANQSVPLDFVLQCPSTDTQFLGNFSAVRRVV